MTYGSGTYNCGLSLGDRVRKISGYRWPGEVVAIFKTKRGMIRVVVECTVPEVSGALHIYNPEQLQVIEDD
jgi:hypothetical protein